MMHAIFDMEFLLCHVTPSIRYSVISFLLISCIHALISHLHLTYFLQPLVSGAALGLEGQASIFLAKDIAPFSLHLIFFIHSLTSLTVDCLSS